MWMAARTRANGNRNSARRKIRMTTHQNINAPAGAAQEGVTVRYTAKTHTSGGRRGGVSQSDDSRLDVKFSAPGVPGSGTNPDSCLRLVGRPVSLVRWGLWPAK
jgi:hypothetical protein